MAALTDRIARDVGAVHNNALSTSPGVSRIDDLTCCRAVFAGWVFAYHVHLQLGRPDLGIGLMPAVIRGYLGVDGFFVLSGLVLAHAHPCLPLNCTAVLDFWGRRLARLYPVHLAMIVLLAALLVAGLAVGLVPREPERFGIAELVRSLLLIQSWGFSDRLAWNYPSWSISTEWAGYLAFPPLWWLLRRMRPALVMALPPLMLLALAVVAAGAVGLNLTYTGALTRFFPEFIAGMAIVRLAAVAPRLAAGPAIAAIGGMGALVVAFGAGPDWLVVAGIWCLLAGLYVAGLRGGRTLLARLPGLMFLGAISYSFYMSFAPVEMVQASAWRRLGVEPAAHPLLYVLTTTALTLTLGSLAWRFVERPAQRRAGRWLARGPGLASALQRG